MATKPIKKDETVAAGAEAPDAPPIDISDQAVKRLIKLAKKRGYVTIDQINAVLPQEEVNSDQIEDIYAMFNEMGVNVIENDEAEEGEAAVETADDEPDEPEEQAPRATAIVKSERSSEPLDRTDDPVRMYLREMGSVELLSREGEIAIAKRIEAGREAMIAGLCESPLTFQAIIIWHEELEQGKTLLREVIDLEATYAGPDGKGAPKVEPPTDDFSDAPKPRILNEDGDDVTPPEPEPEAFDDEFDGGVSLSAMEAELKPKVLETFGRVADNYKKLRRL